MKENSPHYCIDILLFYIDAIFVKCKGLTRLLFSFTTSPSLSLFVFVFFRLYQFIVFSHVQPSILSAPFQTSSAIIKIFTLDTSLHISLFIFILFSLFLPCLALPISVARLYAFSIFLSLSLSFFSPPRATYQYLPRLFSTRPFM